MNARGSNPKSASNTNVEAPPTTPDALEAAWRDYHARAHELPAHAQARDFLHRDLQEAFARMIPADASVLEAGCGEGDLLAALPNARRMGIDYLPDMIERARASHPDIRFEVGDIAAAGSRLEPAAAGTWDAVICDRLAHSVVDVKALLVGLKRQLAPGGRIYMTAFNYMWELPVRVAEMTGWK